MLFLHAFGGIFSLIIVVGLGYWLAKKGWFSRSSRKMLPMLITNVSLPPFLACNIYTTMGPEELIAMLSGAILPFITMITLFGGAWLFARTFKIDKSHIGLFCACVSNPNTIFIGIPVNVALFGPSSLPFVLLYYFASTIFFWTIGNYFISRDQREKHNSPAPAAGIHWQQILSPPMLGFICGIFLLLSGIRVPDFLLASARLVGEMTTPLALIFIGITLEGIGLWNLRPTRDMIFALTGRMVISPLLLWSLLPLFHLPSLMGKVFIIQSSLPVLMQVAILSAYYNTDAKFGAMMVASSTILSVITIPVYMSLI